LFIVGSYIEAALALTPQHLEKQILSGKMVALLESE
jgi:hypothetical protein